MNRTRLNLKSVVVAVCISMFLIERGSCSTYIFPKGERPLISLAEASQICELVAKKTKVKTFNPTEASLQGSEAPQGGAWSFLQYGKNGEIYRFVVYFPEDLCLLLDEAHGQAIVSAHTHDGTQTEWPPQNRSEPKPKANEPDVFDKK